MVARVEHLRKELQEAEDDLKPYDAEQVCF
jgi:hypothetical protein